LCTGILLFVPLSAITICKWLRTATLQKAQSSGHRAHPSCRQSETSEIYGHRASVEFSHDARRKQSLGCECSSMPLSSHGIRHRKGLRLPDNSHCFYQSGRRQTPASAQPHRVYLHVVHAGDDSLSLSLARARCLPATVP
jgi:hypothetical protein